MINKDYTIHNSQNRDNSQNKRSFLDIKGKTLWETNQKGINHG